MTKFSITYNPYLKECIFKKNGKEFNDSSKFGGKRNEWLQVLLGENGNWKGLFKEIDNACNDDEIEVEFAGRKIDFEDLEYYLEKYPEKHKFRHLLLKETRNDNDIIKMLDQIFYNIFTKREEIEHSMGKEKAEELLPLDMKDESGDTVFDKYQKVKDGIFDVAVIATMSSGKSTLINSLLHTDLLPARNEATTARIASILDKDDLKQFEAECYGKNGELVHERKVIDAKILEEYNGDDKIFEIRIEGNIPSIPSDKMRLRINDTPGPNNSRDKSHRDVTYSMIKENNSVTIYVLNATQLEITDDRQLLYDISNEMRKRGKQSRDRFIFVLNKCDVLDEEEESVEKKIEDTKEYLKQFGIVDPMLIPTSARMALLIHKARNGEALTRTERNDLKDKEDFITEPFLHYEKYAHTSPSILEKLNNQVKKYHTNEKMKDDEILIHTGIPVMEETIKEYIEKYAYPIKIKDAVDDILRIFEELNMKTKFKESIAKDADELEKVKKQIDCAGKIREKGNVVLECFKEEIKGFEIGEDVFKKERKKLENDVDNYAREYYDKKDISKAEADRLIGFFGKKLLQYQEDFMRRVQREMEEQIFDKGNQLFDNYKEKVGEVLNSIEIGKYDFKKLKVFQKFGFSDFDRFTKNHEKDSYKSETRWKKNPEREGFWGRVKFWKPKEISYTEQVFAGKVIDVKEVIVEILTEYREQHNKNLDAIYKNVNENINNFKDVFTKNLSRLNDEIEKAIVEVEKYTKESNVLEQDLKDNREIYEWYEQIEARIENLLKFTA